MKKLITVLVAVVGLSASVVSISAAEITGSFSVDYFNKYVDRNGLKLYGAPVFQPSLTLNLPKNTYFDLWGSYGPAGPSDDFGNELDVTVGRTGEFKGLTLDYGLTYYTIAPLDQQKDDVFLPFVEAGKTLSLDSLGEQEVSLYLRFEVVIPNTIYTGGTRVYLGGRMRNQTPLPRLSLNHDLSVMHDSGGFGVNRGFVVNYKGGADWALEKGRILTFPKVQWYKPLTKFSDRQVELVLGAGFSFNF